MTYSLIRHSMILAFWGLVMSPDLQAQGCSDAGICSLPAFKANQPMAEGADKNSLLLGVSAGAADHSIFALGANLDYRRTFGSSLTLDARVTILSQTGNDIAAAGPGDVYLNLGYAFSEKISLTGGVKIPLANGNAQHDGLPLPMDYQSSLGTLDLILGAGFRFEKWQILMGWQHPLKDNENRFEASYYSSESPLADFQSTNAFKRKGDILLRIAHPVTISDQMLFTPSLLPIYHLGPDVYTDETGFAPVEREIEGSDGLTINVSFQFDVRTGSSSAFQFSLGTPVLVRESRPDGLTRGFVLNAGYRISL